MRLIDNERLILSSEILSLNQEAHPDYMELEIGVVSNQRNLNGVKFTDDFIDNFGETLIDFPLQVDRKELESGNYENLTHKFDGEKLETDSIGVFISTRVAELENGKRLLIGNAKVWKRYEQTVDAIIELYNEGLLRASVEALITKYTFNEDGRDAIEGRIIGNTIVSNPAEVDAKPLLLVAEAYAQDIENMRGEKMEEKIVVSQKSLEDIKNELSGLINDAFSEENARCYIVETFLDHVIIEKWDTENYETIGYYRVNYSMDEETVLISENIIEVEKVWIPKENISDVMTISQINIRKEIATKELELKEISSALQEKEKEVVELEENTNKTNEMAQEIINLNEEIKTLKEDKDNLETELSQVKEKLDIYIQAESEAKKEELKAMAERHIGTELSESVLEAIESIDETAVKLAIAEALMVKAEETAEDEIEEDEEEDNVEIASEEEKIKENVFA